MKQTPFFAQQKSAGAKFVDFAGWQMPIQFTGVLHEHHAVRNNVGLFDVSHMGEFILEGPEALNALQYALTNNVARLNHGEALYSPMCQHNGGIVDDLIVYRETSTRFFIVVNASRITDDFKHLSSICSSFDCTLTNASEQWAQLALQGPNATKLLTHLTQSVLPEKPFHFCDGTVGDVKNVRIASTGYTGSGGFELYCKSTVAPALWEAIIYAGEAYDLVLCGLGCRDTLRLEMGYCLYGNDIDLTSTPLEALLGWTVKWDVGDFVGKDALLLQKEKGVSRKLVALEITDRGIARAGHEIFLGDEKIGVVTSGTHSPSLKQAIALAYVDTQYAAKETKLTIDIRGKRVAATVKRAPFYKL